MVLLVFVATVTLLADLATKTLAESALSTGPVHALSVGTSRVDLALAHNPGAAFSMLEGLPEKVRVPLLAGVAALAAVLIVISYRRLPADKMAARVGLALVLGGALGNMVDRLRAGAVVDFIRVTRGEHAWPTFNVADIAITCGAALLFLSTLARPSPSSSSSVARSP